MKFSTREDIEAPIAHVFDRVSDFAGFERMALRRGMQVNRTDDGPVVVGSQWNVAFQFRGRERKMQLTLDAMRPPEMYRCLAVSGGLNAQTDVELVALSPRRTRLAVSIELRPRSLTARVLLQSMKLAKTRLNKRFKARVLEYAETVEASYHDLD